MPMGDASESPSLRLGVDRLCQHGASDKATSPAGRGGAASKVR